MFECFCVCVCVLRLGWDDASVSVSAKDSEACDWENTVAVLQSNMLSESV